MALAIIDRATIFLDFCSTANHKNYHYANQLKESSSHILINCGVCEIHAPHTWISFLVQGMKISPSWSSKTLVVTDDHDTDHPPNAKCRCLAFHRAKESHVDARDMMY